MGDSRRSRCTIPEGAPYEWEDYAEPRNRLVENELEACLQVNCSSMFELETRAAAVDSLKDRAHRGELEMKGPKDRPGEILPVQRDPELWELRWSFGGNPLRLYHSEPESHPSRLLALKYHWKVVEGSSEQITADQNDHMDVATERFKRWRDRGASS